MISILATRIPNITFVSIGFRHCLHRLLALPRCHFILLTWWCLLPSNNGVSTATIAIITIILPLIWCRGVLAWILVTINTWYLYLIKVQDHVVSLNIGWHVVLTDSLSALGQVHHTCRLALVLLRLWIQHNVKYLFILCSSCWIHLCLWFSNFSVV